MIIKESMQLGDAEFSIETGRIAKQAHGSVVIRHGDTMVLISACGTKKAREGQDFFPLTVDYRESFYSAGKFPGGFFKREGKSSTKETLVSRLIDRPMRPMFEEGYMGETQIIAHTLSYDGVHDPDALALAGGPTAAFLSPLPFPAPLAGVRVGMIGDQFLINPTMEQRENSALDLLVAGTRDSIVMVEAGAEFISETVMVEALAKGHEAIGQIIDLIEKVAAQMNITRWDVEKPQVNEAFAAELEERFGPALMEALCVKGKHANDEAVKAVKEQAKEAYAEDEEKSELVSAYFAAMKEKLFRNYVLDARKRTDGRAFDEVRPISCEVGYLPNSHGSAIFTRGETQALVSLTLGTSSDSQVQDSIQGETRKRFMLHYNFPPYSVGECRPMRGPGRREIGHGALAERALTPVVPADKDFQYTIRLVSDILESNGSSSMASVCGGCLALFDGGVPVTAPVAGVAMGLVMEGDKYAVLTDIQGAEDHYGDMDFKVTGNEQGITALQMDIKIKGLTKEIMAEALEQARGGRQHILNKMMETLNAPRTSTSENAPSLVALSIPTDKIRDVIGPGGKMIRGIVEKTGAKIDIEDDGSCLVFGTDRESAESARKMIEDLIAVPEEGKSYLGKITRIVDFGAFVQILPNTEGLLHISEIANYRVRAVSDELQEGQEVMVKVLAVERNGKIRLSRRALLEG